MIETIAQDQYDSPWYSNWLDRTGSLIFFENSQNISGSKVGKKQSTQTPQNASCPAEQLSKYKTRSFLKVFERKAFKNT